MRLHLRAHASGLQAPGLAVEIEGDTLLFAEVSEGTFHGPLIPLAFSPRRAFILPGYGLGFETPYSTLDIESRCSRLTRNVDCSSRETGPQGLAQLLVRLSIQSLCHSRVFRLARTVRAEEVRRNCRDSREIMKV